MYTFKHPPGFVDQKRNICQTCPEFVGAVVLCDGVPALPLTMNECFHDVML